MTSELPFPITFDLPDNWMLVAPESCGHPEAAFVAVRRTTGPQPIATNVAVNGLVGQGQPVDVAELAASYLANMQSQYPVTVLQRDVMAAGSATESAQLLQIEFPVGDAVVAVKQIQLINAFPGRDDPTTTAILQLLFTCPADVFAQAGPEFTRIVATISTPQS